MKRGYVKATEPAEWKSQHLVLENDELRDGIDYHTLTYKSRSINLETVMAPAGSIVTGVRLRLINDRLTLQIRATEFNFASGELNNNSHKWIFNDMNIKRQPLILHRTDISTKSQLKSIPYQNPNLYIEFGPTDIDDDVSQTTIPFIDIQLVEPIIPIPLSGVGLYYKGRPYYGGFIAPKLITYNFAQHITL